MPLDANVVANQFLDRGQRDAVSIEPMKLQKLMYLAHGWHLAFLNDGLIAQEIEAWKYGPVIPEVYREFKEFKASPITRIAPVASGSILPSQVQAGLLDNVWNIYKDKSGIYLSMLTHESGSAWEIARRDCGRWYSPVIPNVLIRDEFIRRKQAPEVR
jgi:uncharacterized phage-associated protein